MPERVFDPQHCTCCYLASQEIAQVRREEREACLVLVNEHTHTTRHQSKEGCANLIAAAIRGREA